MNKSRPLLISFVLSILSCGCSSDEGFSTSGKNNIPEDSLVLTDWEIIYNNLDEQFYLSENYPSFEIVKTLKINKEKETESDILFTFDAGLNFVFHFIFDKNKKKLFRNEAFTSLPIYNGKRKNDNSGILFMDSGHSLNGFLEYINNTENQYAIEDSNFIDNYFSFFYEDCTILSGEQLIDKVELRSDEYSSFTFSRQNNVGVEFNSDLRKYILILEFVAYRGEALRNQPKFHALTYYLYIDNRFFFPHLDSY